MGKRLYILHKNIITKKENRITFKIETGYYLEHIVWSIIRYFTQRCYIFKRF